jgi:hypothetical protein
MTPPPTVVDAQETVVGVDSGNAPALLPENVVAWAWNCDFSNNYPAPRPGWRYLLTVGKFKSRPRISLSGMAALIDGRFQGAWVYQPDSGLPHFVIVSGGKVFAVIGDLFSGQDSLWDVREWAGQFRATADRVWGVQAENYLILQDSAVRPKFYREGELREAGFPPVGEVRELPPGRAMGFMNGRVWVASHDGRSFMAGDATRGPSGHSTFGFRDAVLKRVENSFLAQGGYFAVPFSAGEIRAFTQLAQADTPAGTGPMVALTESVAFAINLPLERESWADLRSPPITVLGGGEGIVGPMAFCNVNGDLLYRSPSGIRSLRRGYRDLSGGWTNRTLSWEMQRVMAQSDVPLLRNVTAATFRHRALFTDLPETFVTWRTLTPSSERGIVYRWIDSLLLSGISGISSEAPPQWQGVWTGLKILQLLPTEIRGKPRLFAIALTDLREYAVFELDENLHEDVNSIGVNQPIEWGFETRLLFGKERLQRKKLKDLEFGLTGIVGTVTIKVFYRQQGQTRWAFWREIEVRAPQGMCLPCASPATGMALPKNTTSGVAYPVRFGGPDDTECPPGIPRPISEGYAFQLRVELSGVCVVQYLLVSAVVLPRIEAAECQQTIELEPDEFCTSSKPEFSYEVL